jgi:sugar lactone lactonase YvrE
VSSLPGGPEGQSQGAWAAVYRVNPVNGTVTLIASGFAGATDLAISPAGTIYVAELFGDRISLVNNGAPEPLVALRTPAAIEWAAGALRDHHQCLRLRRRGQDLPLALL